jgi:hypothetical protein
MRPILIACAAAVLALTGCGGGGDQPGSGSPSPSSSVSNAPSELGTLKASGFGQADEYVWATALVHNNSDYVGQTVTVSFNVLDAGGEILGTESQVESFVRPGADHVIGTQIALEPGQKAATVEATLDVEASGTFSDQPFPDMPVSDVKVNAGTAGYPAVTFVVSNPLPVPLRDPRIQVACTDASGAIIGGGSDYPALIPAGGKIKVDAHVIASVEPTDCTVFVGALDWEGVPSAANPTGTTTSAPSAQAASSSAEDAFKVWVGQFGERNWKAQYKTMVNAQRKVVSESDYVACRSAEAPPKITWDKTLSVTDAGETSIPGTKASLPSTKVTAQVKVDGINAPVDAHMFLEDGTWKWSMTKENISNCSK